MWHPYVHQLILKYLEISVVHLVSLCTLIKIAHSLLVEVLRPRLILYIPLDLNICMSIYLFVYICLVDLINLWYLELIGVYVCDIKEKFVQSFCILV